MEPWTKLSDHSSENDATNDTDIDDEPIDLKQVDRDNGGSRCSMPSDWESLRLIKAKAFSIKDILGLDDKEKLRSSESGDRRKATEDTLAGTGEFAALLCLIKSWQKKKFRSRRRLNLMRSISSSFSHDSIFEMWCLHMQMQISEYRFTCDRPYSQQCLFYTLLAVFSAS